MLAIGKKFEKIELNTHFCENFMSPPNFFGCQTFQPLNFNFSPPPLIPKTQNRESPYQGGGGYELCVAYNFKQYKQLLAINNRAITPLTCKRSHI